MNDTTRTNYASAIEQIGTLLEVSIADCPRAWKESEGRPVLEIDLDSAVIEIQLSKSDRSIAGATAFLVKAASKRVYSHGRNVMSAADTDDLMQVISDLCEAFQFACAERRAVPDIGRTALQIH